MTRKDLNKKDQKKEDPKKDPERVRGGHSTCLRGRQLGTAVRRPPPPP